MTRNRTELTCADVASGAPQQDHVGTEMLVVGLLAEGSGGAKALQQLGVHYSEAPACDVVSNATDANSRPVVLD